MTWVLGILLACSVALNAWQENRHTEASVRFGTTSQLAADAKAAAGTCSASVDKLAQAGRAREKRLIGALERIAPEVKADQLAALQALKDRPDNPQDLCGSLERYLRGKIKAEKKGSP